MGALLSSGAGACVGAELLGDVSLGIGAGAGAAASPGGGVALLLSGPAPASSLPDVSIAAAEPSRGQNAACTAVRSEVSASRAAWLA